MRPQSPTEQAMLTAITAEPGLSLKHYWGVVSETYTAASKAARSLRRDGLVRSTGETSAKRWFPVI